MKSNKDIRVMLSKANVEGIGGGFRVLQASETF